MNFAIEIVEINLVEDTLLNASINNQTPSEPTVSLCL